MGKSADSAWGGAWTGCSVAGLDESPLVTEEPGRIESGHRSMPCLRLVALLWALSLSGFHAPFVQGQAPGSSSTLPESIRVVLEQAQPLVHPRGGRLPFLILPISGQLRGLDDRTTERALVDLAARGIGYGVPWVPADRDATAAEAIRIARLSGAAGPPIAMDATACLDGFFDGSPETLHIDDQGKPFWDSSFDPGRKMGCPLTLASRIPMMRQRVEFFLRALAQAGIVPDLVFADWEIDGPLEWNEAWAHSKRCQRCRAGFERLEDFREFQKKIRSLRSELQRRALSEPVLARHPKAWVGNYGVYPHGGHRYWYDYFERETLAVGVPFVAEQKARYREWAHEFEGTGYTLAMPVVYTWYPIFGWYDFTPTDYRWFYNGLRVGSNSGQHTSRTVPLLTFVHRETTAPPPQPDPSVRPFSQAAYQELLWHLLLRGHDGFFLWCLPGELAEETRIAHAVYAAALEYRSFLDQGEPVSFAVPSSPGPVVSALRLGNRLLVRRTDFTESTRSQAVQLAVGDKSVMVESSPTGCRIIDLPR